MPSAVLWYNYNSLYISQWGNWGLNDSGALLKRSHSKECRTNSYANLPDFRAHLLNHNPIYFLNVMGYNMENFILNLGCQIQGT